MNGIPYNSSWIGALGENSIYEYIKGIDSNTSNFVVNTSNILNINSSNYTLTKCSEIDKDIDLIVELINGTCNVIINGSGLQVYHKDILNPLNNGWLDVDDRLIEDRNDIITIKGNISGIDSTITTIQGQITSIQGEITANTTSIATNTASITTLTTITGTNSAAITANGIITVANTIAISGLNSAVDNCLKKENIDSGDIGLYQSLGGAFLNIVFNTTHFKDVAIFGTNRQFNLNDEYANLPIIKQNKIIWNSPLNYNTLTDTASIDLSSYSPINITPNYTYLNSYTSNYISSNILTNIISFYSPKNITPNYTYLNNYTSNYISSNILNNIIWFYSPKNITPNYTYLNNYTSNYISSNIINNIIGFYSPLNITPNYTYLNNYTSNYISSNTINDIIGFYSPLNITPNYTYLNNYTSNYISSNILNDIIGFYSPLNITPNYTHTSNYISSNIINDIIGFYSPLNITPNYTYLNNYTSNYISYDVLSNKQYISSNDVENLYISSNIASNILLNYATKNEIYYKQDVYSIEREYPPQIYDSVSAQTTTTFLGRTVYTETLSLNTALYGNGDYVLYSSTVYTGRNKYLFLDKNLTTFGGTAFTYTQPAGTYAYNGTTVNSYIEDSYKGEWIIIKFPSPLILTSYKFRFNTAIRAPSLFRFYGSMDGVNFTQIVEASNDTIPLVSGDYISSIYQKIINTSFNTPYLYIGFCCNKVVGGDSSAVTLLLQEFYIYGKEKLETLTLPIYSSSNAVENLYVSSNIFFNNIIPNYITSNQLYTDESYYSIERQYPSKLYNTFTEQTETILLYQSCYEETINLDNTNITYGSGDYKIYVSTSSLATDRAGKQLFNYILNEETSSIHFAGAYNTSGYYLGSSRYIINGYYGDWVIIQLPNPIILTKFIFYNRPSQVIRAPSLWKCYGSMDGITFIEIVEASNDTTALISSAYTSSKYEKNLNTSFNTPYKYIGFVFNKVISLGGILNFSELQIFGKEYIVNIKPTFISSNALSNILTPYSKINDINNFSSNLISSNVITNVLSSYIPKVISTSNLYLDTPLQILPNTQPQGPGIALQNSSLMVGDGGRLIINGNYGNSNTNVSRIGVKDTSSGGSTNTNITLYEKGYITYFSSINSSSYGHSFLGNVSMSSLSIASQTVPNPNIRFEVGGSGSGANPFTIDIYGNITLNKVTSANNLTLKAPLYFNVTEQTTISGKTVYKYDLDLSLYTRYFQTMEGHKVRYFKITTIYSNPTSLDGASVQAYNYIFNNTFYMTDYNGLTMYCNDNWTNTQCEFIVNDTPINYWIRNSFNYITFINRLSIANNRKWYIIIQDYLS